jgi:tetratricopeptide (TPR) repeat protein
VQDDIAFRIVQNIKGELLSSLPKVTQVQPEAYDLYLRGQFLARRVGKDNLEKAVVLFERSIQVDSEYAPVWASLGTAYRNQAQYGYRDLDEGTAEARKAIERSLILDPNLGTAWARLGVINLTYDRDFDAAKIATERALELQPNSVSALGAAAKLAVIFGDLDEAVRLRKKTVVIAPSNLAARMMLGWDQMFGGQLDDAEATLRALLELDPNYPIGHLLLGQVYLLKGMPEQAINEMGIESEPEWGQFGTVLALHALERHEEEIESLNDYIGQYGDVWLYQIAVAHAYHNNVDEAFEWLELGYKKRDSGMVLLQADPFFENICDDPRWTVLVSRLGLINRTSAR